MSISLPAEIYRNYLCPGAQIPLCNPQATSAQRALQVSNQLKILKKKNKYRKKTAAILNFHLFLNFNHLYSTITTSTIIENLILFCFYRLFSYLRLQNYVICSNRQHATIITPLGI